MDMKEDDAFHIRVRSAKNINGNQLIDLTGMTFGSLKVKKVDRTKSTAVNKGIPMANAYWLCLCNLCGCRCSVRSDILRKGLKRCCRDCWIESMERVRERFRELQRLSFLNELNRVGFEGMLNKKPKKKRTKVIKVSPGTLAKPVRRKAFSGDKGLRKVKELRATGMSVADIAELLETTKDKVIAEIRRKD